MTYLFSVAIGPIQDFIAAARRTRDLRYGSWILSELSKAVALKFHQHGKLIFPFSDSLDTDLQPSSEYSVTNKILATVDVHDDEALKKLARDMKTAADERLRILKSKAVGIAKRYAVQEGGLDEHRLDVQLSQFVECSCAWVPYDETRHGACRDAVESWMAARKTLRDFHQHDGAPIPKSSLTGDRETVIRENSLKKEQFFIKTNEQLDGIGLVKRFVDETPYLPQAGAATGKSARKTPGWVFDSTIDIAAGPYIARLRRRMPTEMERYERFLGQHKNKIPFSYSYLYREETPEKLSGNLSAELSQILAECKFPEPKPPYYAYLIGDGDGMGDVISQMKTRELHRDFSRSLSQFAGSVRNLATDKDLWNIVFAGGDDIMALLPLHEAIDAARQLRRCFTTAVGGLEKPPTLSAGLVIAHATASLTEVRQAAKMAEKAAKKFKSKEREKDALCIVAAPRSGAPVQVVDHWDNLLPELEKAVGFYAAREISPSFAYGLRDLLDSTYRRRMTHLDEALFPMARAIAEKKDARKPFLDWLDAEAERDAANPRDGLVRLSNLLLVARPIARAVREAQS